MANKRKGQLAVTGEWGKHLRQYLKRQFWKKDRTAGKKEISRNLNETNRLLCSPQEHDNNFQQHGVPYFH